MGIELQNDDFRHKGLRKRLVEELRRKGIHEEAVLKAIGTVPRHVFIDSAFVHFAYKDQAFPIGAGQTISQPYTVAFQTQLLEVKKMDKILEIGTGSGYQTAVLLEMGAKVFTIERQKELFLFSQVILKKLGYDAHFFYGDGYAGKESYAPFDKILITAGTPEIPDALIQQLKPGGLLVAPVGNIEQQTMVRLERKENGDIVKTNHGAFVFVPLLKGVS